MEVAFALLVVATIAYTLRITGGSYFWADDWPVVKQAGSAGNWLDAYNKALSLPTMINDRALVEVFGFAHTPFRVVGIVSLFAIPAAYFLTTRRQFGASAAALLALPLLLYGRHISLLPTQSNHYFALLGAIGCAAALNRGRRADWILAAALTFSLCSAGGGVAVAAACLVHNACVRPPIRRWLAVLGPTLLYVVWWLIAVGEWTDLGPYSRSTSATVRFVRDLSYTPFESAGLGSAVIGMSLAAAFVGYGIWTLSRGLDSGANFVAWSAGVAAWAIGVATSRGLLADVGTFRYRYTALGLVLLAVVPRRPIVVPAWFLFATDRRRAAFAGALVILVIGSARGLAVRSDLQASGSEMAASGRVDRARLLVIGLGPTVIADDTVLPFVFGWLRAADVRALLARYGNPFPATRATADQQLVDMEIVRSQSGVPHDPRCERLSEPFAYLGIGEGLFLWSPDTPFAVDVRRFGHDWVRLDEARPGETLRLGLPAYEAKKPWEVRADGACRISP